MKTLKAYLVLAAAAGALVGAASPASATINLVQNPGFETGDTSSWSTGPFASAWYTSGGVIGGGVAAPPDGGKYFAYTGCINEYCNLSQTLGTNAGSTYNLSFEFNPGLNAGGGNGDTQVFWNATRLLDINGGSLGWSTYTVNGLLAQGSDTLTFSGYQIPYYNGLDNISVTAVPGPVPGAGLTGLAALALAGLYARTRRA